MSSLVVERALPAFQIVDLDRVSPTELAWFWEREVGQWRERLLWDVSGAVEALRKAMERGGVRGKAVRTGGRVAAYAYYIVEADRAVLSGLAVAPEWRGSWVGRTLLRAVVEELHRHRVRRIESQFLSFEGEALVACFEGQGFRTFWRDFLRAPVAMGASAPKSAISDARVAAAERELTVLSWNSWSLSEAAVLMRGAHEGGVDAEMNELYRTTDGCRLLLDNILRQRGCGAEVADASAIARERATERAVVGFTIATETSARNGHLAQLAVLPPHQGRGVGRLLLGHTFSRLERLGFETLSLMVSAGNDRARSLYRGMGFEPVFRFPVFAWEA